MPKPLNPDLVSKQFMIRKDQHEWLEDQAIANKRSGNQELDSISKVLRTAIDDYRNRIEKKKPGK